MLEKPNIPDALIQDRLRAEFGLPDAQVEFLPLGADANTAVYRVTHPGGVFFLKLRKSEAAALAAFDPASVRVPAFLHQQGVPAIIAPLPTLSGEAWGDLSAYKMILYPFVQGEDSYARELTEAQWAEFGAALKAVHNTALPPALSRLVPRETFDPRWRRRVQAFQAQATHTTYADPVAVRLAAFMAAHLPEIDHLLSRAEELGRELQTRPLPFVLCHADIHAGNLLITPAGALYIVDWDAPIFAPKERDLMFIGAGISGRWNKPREEALFYRGYGPAAIDRTALAYYRFERIVEDIAAFCEQLLGSDLGGEDREQAYTWFISNFSPGGVIDIAIQTDPTPGGA